MDVFIARQPIFDRHQKVIFYELLFRFGSKNEYDAIDGDKATLGVIQNSFYIIGMDKLTGGKRAFINFTDNLLRDEVATMLPNNQVAIEILETVKPTEEIIKACRKLKELGYMLVLDDFVFKPEFIPLIELADIIKVDFLSTPLKERIDIIHKVKNKNVKFLAEKVETREEFEMALLNGYSYFQGYFFSKPAIVSGKDIPSYKLHNFKILKEISKNDISFDDLENIINRDVALSYKLFKYINSSAFGLKTKINSIKQALVLIGKHETIRWMTLILLSGIASDKPSEIVMTSVIRARFGELIALKMGLTNKASDVFLMGMFSLIDTFIDKPIFEILDELPIAEDIKLALLGGAGELNDILALILIYEKAQWDKLDYIVSKLNLNRGDIPYFYVDAIEWAQELLSE